LPITPTSGSSLIALGNVAHDAADSGNPIKVGGYASTTVPTAVAAADRVNAWYGLNGQAMVQSVDPCATRTKQYYRINTATSGNYEIANAVSGEFFYVCAIDIVTTLANSVLIAEDDTDGCGSPSAGVSSGGTTAATGWPFAANGGIAKGTGQAAVLQTTTANRYFCFLMSVSTQTSGTIQYVSAP
jgi:hypothetical protein